MSVETKKVLELLAAGKITPDEAQQLLDKLNSTEAGRESASAAACDGVSEAARKARFLRITVDSPDREQVNLRLPLSFLRTGVGIVGILPRGVSRRLGERLAEKGLDLSMFSDGKGDQIVDALRELNLDMDAKDGKKVRIYCE